MNVVLRNTETTQSTWLKQIARQVLPSGVRQLIRRVVKRARDLETAWSLYRMRRRWESIPPGSHRTQRLLHYVIHINHAQICYHLYKDIFVNQIYRFEAQRPNPLIIDCGSNMGMTILYFKYIYPQSRIIGFEPDRGLFPYLQKNIELNKLTDVTLHQAAIAAKEGIMKLCSHDMVGSSLADHAAEDIPAEHVEYKVPTLRLRDYLCEPVDFLKINIEGAEWEVLADSEDCLRQVREMVIEYHHLPGLPRTLHDILHLLHRQGYEYAVSDFGLACYGTERPPVSLDPGAHYFRHVYARRID